MVTVRVDIQILFIILLLTILKFVGIEIIEVYSSTLFIGICRKY